MAAAESHLCCAAEKSMHIAADACIYTNHNFTTELITNDVKDQAEEGQVMS